MAHVRVLGAGPAGSSAALAAMRHGATVEIYEKSAFPRHKVCGEFISPATARLFESLGIWGRVEALHPARLRHMLLRFEKAEKRARLPETAYGLSRYAMDEVLLHSVVDRGARLIREHGEVGEGITVIATGRTSSAVKGNRLFGFKAHFSGPVNDVMELYFLGRHSYVGVSAIEAGLTNVCGLAPENELVRYGFDIGAFLDAHAPIRERIQPLRQQWKWLNVGPLVFENRLSRESEVGRYFAGDALSFVDPFTGSGILSAVYTGSLAGRRAAGESGVAEYTKEAGKVLRAGLLGARTIRLSIKCGLAPALLPFIPSQLLFHATRPHPAVI